ADQFVCRSCFGNPGLRVWVTENAIDPDEFEPTATCSFCKPLARSSVLAELDGLCEYVVSCLETKYADPNDELPWDSGEAGWQGEVMDKYEVLEDAELDLPNDSKNRLLESIVDAMYQDEWCEKDYFRLSEGQEYRFSWEEFVETSIRGSVLEFMYGQN